MRVAMSMTVFPTLAELSALKEFCNESKQILANRCVAAHEAPELSFSEEEKLKAHRNRHKQASSS